MSLIVPEPRVSNDKPMCQWQALQQCDQAPSTDPLPWQAQYQSLKLLVIEFELRTLPNAGPIKPAVIQSSRRQPDTHAVIYQNFNSIGAAIGEQISAMRLRRTEHGNDPRLTPFRCRRACPPVRWRVRAHRFESLQLVLQKGGTGSSFFWSASSLRLCHASARFQRRCSMKQPGNGLRRTAKVAE